MTVVPHLYDFSGCIFICYVRVSIKYVSSSSPLRSVSLFSHTQSICTHASMLVLLISMICRLAFSYIRYVPACRYASNSSPLHSINLLLHT